ncbi:MAG: nucleotidyltransferase domain-containing protein [Bacteroidota bacterium]
MKAAIQHKLSSIALEKDLTILYACESGSRAWGFPSPDSDYDVRFVYLKPHDWYFSIHNRKDMLQYPINEDLDVIGWDIRKFLRLFGKSNATPFEWLQSPIIYEENLHFKEKVWALAESYCQPRHLINHYLGIGRNALKAGLEGDSINIKKYFYVLRPLLAARWIITQQGVPPLEFKDLLTSLEGETDLLAAIHKLWERKLKAKEGEFTPVIPIIQEFVHEEMERCRGLAEDLPPNQQVSIRPLDELFRSFLNI